MDATLPLRGKTLAALKDLGRVVPLEIGSAVLTAAYLVARSVALLDPLIALLTFEQLRFGG